MRFAFVIAAAMAVNVSDIGNKNVDEWVVAHVKDSLHPIPLARPEVGPPSGKERNYPPYGTPEWPAATNPTYKPTEAEKAADNDKKQAEI